MASVSMLHCTALIWAVIPTAAVFWTWRRPDRSCSLAHPRTEYHTAVFGVTSQTASGACERE